MRTCPSCGRQNPGEQDFCACGEYLRWEPTDYMPAVAAPEPDVAEPDPATAGPRETPASTSPPPTAGPTAPSAADGDQLAAVKLDVPGQESEAGHVAVGVNPGERARVMALVRNQSDIVDNYAISVRGLPRDWWSATPDTVYLVPFGAAGTYEQTVEIELHPPRTADAQARLWELAVVVSSTARSCDAAHADLTLGIQPFEDYETRVEPERASGRLRARFSVSVKNKANAPVAVALAAADAEGACRFSFDRRLVEVPPGETASSPFSVRPRRQILLGRPLDRRFEVQAASGDAGAELLAQAGDAMPSRAAALDAPGLPGVSGPRVYQPNASVGPDGLHLQGPQVRGPRLQGVNVGAARRLDLSALKPASAAAPPPTGPLLPTQAVFRQKAWLPWWLAIVVPLLVLLAVLFALFVPRNVEVPDVTGSTSVFHAEQQLTKAGLKLDPDVKTKVTTRAKPGTVVAQTPEGGDTARRGSAVSLEIAVGSGAKKVPSVVGKTLVEAEKSLRAAGLAVGKTSVQPPDPKAAIRSQIPGAGQVVKEGTPIDLYYAEQGKAGGGGGGGGGAVAVPAIDPKDPQGYGRKLADAGLVPKVENRFSTAKTATVFATDPAPGTKVVKGATVTVLVSAGPPGLTFDDDQNVLLINGVSGKPLPAIAESDAREKDPTWSADGKHVAYTADGRVMLADTTRPDGRPRALTPTGELYADLSFAPTTDAAVLASARIKNDRDRDLCIGRVTAEAGYRPQCIDEPDFSVANAHWSADGKTLLAWGVKAKAFGIVRYRSPTPFSPRAADWGSGTFVTPLDTGGTGVRDAAVSPDGKILAAVANLDTDEFRLYLTKPDDFGLQQAKALPVRACKVAWRADSKELVIVKLGQSCLEDTGELARVAVDAPTTAISLSASGDNPAFPPLVPGG